MRAVRFLTNLPCRSGICQAHVVRVVATYDDDDGGAFMRLESVRLLYGKYGLYREKDVQGRLDAGETMRLQCEAEQEWERAGRANVVEGG